MWRRLGRCDALKQSISVAVGRRPLPSPQSPQMMEGMIVRTSPAFRGKIVWIYSSSSDVNAISDSKSAGGLENLTFAEAKKLMRLVNVESLKTKLEMEGKEVIGYSELLEACKSMDVARSLNEAIAFARVLDEAGVVLVFRDKVYLHPGKVVDLVRKAMPLALAPEDDPIKDELKMLLEQKEEIDVQAHKEVRRILWTGLGLTVGQVGLFFRLTFWEFSWDVMEPITYFTTSIIVVICYAYFLFTSRDPTYQDLMKRLFLSRQRKLFLNHNFDVGKLKALQNKCKTPLDASASIGNHVGLKLELGDALHKD